MEITNECAQVFFKNYDYTNEEIYHIESDSYVLYSFGNQIMLLHKSSCIQRVLLDDLEDAAGYLKERRLIVSGDSAYYTMNNALYIEDLATGKKEIVELKQEDDNCRYRDLWLYEDSRVIYKKGFDYFIMDLGLGAQSEECLEIMGDTSNVFLYGDHLYFLEYSFKNDDLQFEQYRLMRYGLKNKETTAVTKPFGTHDSFEGIKAVYNCVAQGVYNDCYYCVFEYKGTGDADRQGLDCFWMNMKPGSMSEVKQFFIWSPHIYQIEQYKDKLIYINGGKNFSLIEHFYMSDRKKTLIKGCGEERKQTLSERFLMGRGVAQIPEKYARVGKWIRVRRRPGWANEIVEIKA